MRKAIDAIITIVIVFGIMAGMLFFITKKGHVQTIHTIDTVILRDTIRDTLMVPQKVYIVRVDTITLPVYSIPEMKDSTLQQTPILLEIERKEYATQDYRAVVEGFMANLVSMEVYPETRFITDHQVKVIKKQPKFGVGIHAGYGIGKDGMSPYIGVGLQYNIFTF